jgi:hypothetical protein
VTRKEQVAAEIERKIAERDRLWAHAQGPRAPTGLEVIQSSVTAAERDRLMARVEVLEEGLARYLDPDWLAQATVAELAAHARAVLRRRTRETPAHGVLVSSDTVPASPRQSQYLRALVGR